MLTKLAFLLILFDFQKVYNSPLREAKELHQVPVLVQQHNVPVPVILTHREKKSPNYISIPINQYLVPKLHVIPAQSNVHHSSIHTEYNHIVTNNLNVPILTQTVTHSATNITHPHSHHHQIQQSVIPLLIPIHHNFVQAVPVQDLTVIPLQKNVHKIEHFKMAEKKEEEEEVNRFRTFYGGFGTGLFFGGQGAGHGFHIFG